MCLRPLAEVTAALAAQTHRRFIKTHTPLDGLPQRADVTYLVVGRDPRDVAVSWEHHAANMDFARALKLRAAAIGNEDLAEFPPPHRAGTRLSGSGPSSPTRRAPLRRPRSPRCCTTSTRAGGRRDANVALFHFADLTADLPGELLRLARVLGIPCAPARAGELAAQASLVRMRERAADVAPNASLGTWKDVRAFFRSGGTGEWRARLSAADLAAYEARVAQLVAPDLAAWAHGGWLASGIDPAR